MDCDFFFNQLQKEATKRKMQKIAARSNYRFGLYET